MISHAHAFLSCVDVSNDIILAKVVRNLAKWTHDVQQCIGMAFASGDSCLLSSMTSNPAKYLQYTKDQCIDTTAAPYAMYRELNYWSDTIPKIIQLCSASETGSVSLEMMGTLNHLTRLDLPISETWEAIIVQYSLISLLRKITIPGMNDADLKLEAIILCNQMCQCSASANLIAESNVLNDLLKDWEERDEDMEVHLHILTLCEKLLGFEGSRSTILLGTGKYNLPGAYQLRMIYSIKSCTLFRCNAIYL